MEEDIDEGFSWNCAKDDGAGTCLACEMGYFDDFYWTCAWKCEAGAHLYSEFEGEYDVNSVTAQSCETCYNQDSGDNTDDGCISCVGSESNHCTRCKTGHYLERETGKNHGTCMPKVTTTDTVSILVQIDENASGNPKDGDTEPFDQLMDAIAYVFSLAAQTELLTAEILLETGDHYELFTAYKYQWN
jgi:hypothetical protein